MEMQGSGKPGSVRCAAHHNALIEFGYPLGHPDRLNERHFGLLREHRNRSHKSMAFRHRSRGHLYPRFDQVQRCGANVSAPEKGFLPITGIAIEAHRLIMSKSTETEAIATALLCFPDMPTEDALLVYRGAAVVFSEDGNTMTIT
jgi:hypothetical protein